MQSYSALLNRRRNLHHHHHPTGGVTHRRGSYIHPNLAAPTVLFLPTVNWETVRRAFLLRSNIINYRHSAYPLDITQRQTEMCGQGLHNVRILWALESSSASHHHNNLSFLLLLLLLLYYIKSINCILWVGGLWVKRKKTFSSTVNASALCE